MVKNGKLLDERRAWVNEISELTTAHLKDLAEFDAAVDAAAAQVKSAEEALKEAKEAHRATLFPRSYAALRFSRQRDLLEAQLRDSSPAEVDECLREIQAAVARLQVSGNPKTISDRQARANGLRAAAAQVAELRLLPLSPGELAERLDEIRARAADEVGA